MKNIRSTNCWGRDLAAHTLGELKDKRAVPVLEDVIVNWTPRAERGPYNVRKSAKAALEKIRSE